VFYQLLDRCRGLSSKRFRFKNKLLALDATVIELVCGDVSVGDLSGARRAP
jgi:hypothetical protein